MFASLARPGPKTFFSKHHFARVAISKGLLEHGITKVDDMDKLQELMEIVRKFGINKVDDMDDLQEKLAKNIQKHEKPVPVGMNLKYLSEDRDQERLGKAYGDSLG